MKNYYRIMLGERSRHAKKAHEGGFIGAGWFEDIDLTDKIPENWRDFNKKYIPIYLKKNPDRTKVPAGLACGMLHTIARGIKQRDIALCPDGEGSYFVGEIVSDYEYQKDQILPHRRNVRWFSERISRDDMSEPLKNSTGSIGTVSNISRFKDELESLLEGKAPPAVVATDETIEDPNIFALETHLEDFLVQNWQHTELGKKYNIYQEDGKIVSQQYPSDTGPIDILAVSKNSKELLVIELKKGRASDVVVGQL